MTFFSQNFHILPVFYNLSGNWLLLPVFFNLFGHFFLSNMPPLFDTCPSCGTKMAKSDPHSVCVVCLPFSHDPESCYHCRQLSRRILKDGEKIRLLGLMEKDNIASLTKRVNTPFLALPLPENGKHPSHQTPRARENTMVHHRRRDRRRNQHRKLSRRRDRRRHTDRRRRQDQLSRR